MLLYYDIVKLKKIIDLCWATWKMRQDLPLSEVERPDLEDKPLWIMRKYIEEDAYSPVMEHEKKNELLESIPWFKLSIVHITNAIVVMEHPTEHNKIEKCLVPIATELNIILDKAIIAKNGIRSVALSPSELSTLIGAWKPTDANSADGELIHIDHYLDDYNIVRDIHTGEKPVKSEILIKPHYIDEGEHHV